MEMDLKHITAHSGRIITRDLFTQPYPFLNVFLTVQVIGCFSACLFLGKKNCNSNENSNYNYNK